ncbi:MAG: PAS domain S-box protein [Sterolibacterium sp.]
MPDELNILILEDEPVDATLAVQALSKAGLVFSFQRVAARNTFIAALEEFRPNLILADYRLPAFDGLAALAIVRERAPDVPFIFVSGNMGEEFAIETLRQGAADYVLKGYLSKLVPAVNRALRNAEERRRRKQAGEALRDSERRYKQLLDSVTDYIYTVQVEDGHPVATIHGPGCAAVLGYAPEDYATDPGLWSRMVYEPDRAAVMEQAARVLVGEAVPPLEHRILHRNGTRRWVRNTCVARYDQQRRMIAYDGLIVDITERKRSEETLQRVNRELRAISNCNQALVRADDEQTLLDAICRNVCEEAGYRMAWVGYVENDDAKSIRPVAWAGEDAGYLEQAKLTWSDRNERGQGPAGKAVRSGEITYAQDFATDPILSPWRENALQRGYRSAIALPLKDESARVFGVLLIYSTEINAFTPNEIRLLKELSDDLAFGIVALRNRAERKAAELRLQASERHYRTLAENHPDVIVRHDTACRHIYANASTLRVTGQPIASLLGKTICELPMPGNPETLRPLHDSVCNAVASKMPDELEFLWPDGKVFEVRHVPELDEDGAVASVLGIARDISERKRMESLLLQREYDFRSLAENSPDFIVRYDRDCRRTYVNAAFERETGIPVNTALNCMPGTLWRSSISVADYLDRLRQVMATGEPLELVLAWDRPNENAVAHHALHIVAERSPDGSVKGALAIGRNITSLVEAELRLDESNKQLRDLATRRETAREEERRRIARELHDELGQQLSVLRIGVNLLDFQFGKDLPGLSARTTNLRNLVDKTILVTRNVSSALRPAVLDMGIVPALEWLTDEFSRHSGIACDLKLPQNDVHMHEEHAIAVFRIAQESLTNALRHARAERVDIVFACEADVYVLDIRDHGIGFEVDAPRKPQSFGLVGIRERALATGGEVVISSAPGCGTTVRLRLPVVQGNEDES